MGPVATASPANQAELPTLPSNLNLDAIKAPIADELDYFEAHFKGALRSRVMLLDRIMHYIVRRKGKQMRPMFTLLSAQVAGGITPATYRAAALIELLHTATLIHDDVVDEADERRGFFSINALWKNKIAVLVGDYLLSRGLLMSLEADDFELLKITSNAVKQMSEGELLQMAKTRTLNIDEPVYFDIIRQKTASLIAACCASGAASAGASGDDRETLRRFGEAVGMAFQIKDDLFDYGPRSEAETIGKPVGIDLREKKITLPLIHVLNRASWLERRRLISVVKDKGRNARQVQWLVDYVRANGGIGYAYDMMRQFTDEALTLLQRFGDSPARESLRNLVLYTISREK